MQNVGNRVRWALAHAEITPAECARRLGITRGAPSQWWRKENPTTPSREFLPLIADMTKTNIRWLLTGKGNPLAAAGGDSLRNGTDSLNNGQGQAIIATLGEVGAGLFSAVNELTDLEFEREPSAFPPVPGYPIEAQYDLIVRGTSIDRFARDGQRVRCVSIHERQPRENDLVHVQRYRRQRSEVESTIKQLCYVNGRAELRYYSTDPRWDDAKPLELGHNPDDTEVEIIGIALYEFNPAPNMRR